MAAEGVVLYIGLDGPVCVPSQSQLRLSYSHVGRGSE